MYCKNYYSVLKIKKKASFQKIESAYLRLYHKYDQHRGNRLTKNIFNEKIKDVVIAYYILSNSKRRREYDIYRNDKKYCTANCKRDFYDSKAHCSFEDLIQSLNCSITQKILEDDSKNRPINASITDKSIDTKPDKFIPYKKIISYSPNIYLTINLDAEQAIKGCVINFNLENNQKVSVEIPPNTKNGHRTTFKGLGERCPICNKKGAIIVIVYIDM